MKTFTLLCLLLVGTQVAQATHLLGGYIQAKPVAGSSLTYELTVALYMDPTLGVNASSQATSIELCFGDGTKGTVSRQGQVFVLNRSVSINVYRITHTYAGPNTYAITASLPNRNAVKNITDFSSQVLTLATTISTNALNQTPTPGFPESGFRVGVNQKLTLPLKATDSDGDSLVYGLAKALTSAGDEPCGRRIVSSYQFPNDVARQGTFKLNNRTGDLVWDAPTQVGYYSVALTIYEYRNGNLISQTTQEIQLLVEDQPGTPATIPSYEPAFEGAIVTATTSYADADLQLITFPSPVDDRLQVVIQTSNPATATIQLTDINGRNLHELAFNRAARRHEQVIGMGSLTPGVYLLRAVVGGRTLVRKIVKK